MITKDAHVHTNYSPDASRDATFKTYITKAKEIGIKEIIFTDHHDIDAIHPLFENPIDYDEYIKEFKKVKKETNFSMILGVEVGYQSHTTRELEQFLDRYPFEYVILSVHYIEKKDLYTQEYFQNKTKEESYITYFKTCLEAIENTKSFDTFGHLDYITRYSPYGDYSFLEYQEYIDPILKALIKKNINLEINTSGYKTENRSYPKQEVINRYIELGGKNIIYGSDAHSVEELGRNFK
jgi:histidinol-phosphatase (PHP family)